jgi:hypothetical protein
LQHNYLRFRHWGRSRDESGRKTPWRAIRSWRSDRWAVGEEAGWGASRECGGQECNVEGVLCEFQITTCQKRRQIIRTHWAGAVRKGRRCWGLKCPARASSQRTVSLTLMSKANRGF